MKKVEAAATYPDLASAQHAALANIVWVWFQLSTRCRIHVLWVWFSRQAALGDAVCHEKSILAYRRRENGRRLRYVLLSVSNLQRPEEQRLRPESFRCKGEHEPQLRPRRSIDHWLQRRYLWNLLD